MSKRVSELRKAIWHLRKGGLSQYREWQRRKRSDSRYASTKVVERLEPRDIASYYPSAVPLDRPKAFPDLRVGVILDDFSLQAWTPEFDVAVLSLNNWREEIQENSIDLLFVESAWAGNHGQWQYKLTGTRGPSDALRQLVSYCQSVEVPTVFWNKEDPAHFEDFIETAKLFDYVFTSDSRYIPTYKERLGHDRVESLSFAAQPSIHNPIRQHGIERDRDIAFAGMYFAHKYPERREQMELLLGAALRVEKRKTHAFDIFSRHHGGKDVYQFPERFEDNIVGSLPYDKMLSAYKNYKVFLNVNSVVESPSMCARRVFELLASGTPVVSTYSTAIPNFFSQTQLPIVSTEREGELTLRALLNSEQLRDRMVHSAQREIWSKHTYTHRAETMLRHVGINMTSPYLANPSVSVISTTNRPQFVRNVIDSVGSQKNVSVELILCTHGFETNLTELDAYARDKGVDNLKVVHMSAEKSLGEVLNHLVGTSSGKIIAKFDDDDFYAPYYLYDSLNALRYAGADLVGKFSHYLYSHDSDAIYLRNPGKEHQYTRFVSGATLLGTRRLFEDTPFESVGRGEDTRFLQAVEAANGKVYATDRFNFLQIRGNHSHTWNVDEMELLANARAETFGKNIQHVIA